MTSHHQHRHHKEHTEILKGKKLLWVTLLNFSITLVQIAGGIISNSLSLLSDAIHNLGDSSAIFIAWLAGKKGQKKPDKHRTFGYKRVEILAALFNGMVLITICIFLLYEAYKRFINPEPIKGKIMLVIAVFGLLANLISVLVLNKDKNHNLNIKAAYLHLLGDTLSSVAVILSGIAIWLFQIYWLDPLITVFISLYIIYHTWGMVKETVDILMQSTPHNINVDELKIEVEKINEIKNLHHVHIWKLDDKQVHFESHIDLKNNITMAEMMHVKQEVEDVLRNKFKVHHVTLQMGYECCTDNHHLIAEKH